MTNAAMIDARARVFPGSGARRMERAGTFALFDGVGSPLTQTFCLGIFQLPTDEDLDAIENFFLSRGAEVFHEVSPLADAALVELLNRRGYQPVEFTTMLFRELGADAVMKSEVPVAVRIAREGEEELWAGTAARGWSEHAELADFLRDIGRVTAASEGMTSFIAEVDAQPAGTAALSMRDGVALLAGASTSPEFRKQGAQLALLEARLRHAVQHGCDLAMMGAAPGSGSQRNAERQGFRIAYTRVKWRLT